MNDGITESNSDYPSNKLGHSGVDLRTVFESLTFSCFLITDFSSRFDLEQNKHEV